MTIGATLLPAAELPLLNEDQAHDLLLDMRSPYRVPADWWGEDNELLVFTHDRVLAALVADVIAQADTGGTYPSVAGAGVEVEGPLQLVLVGAPEAELVDVRLARPEDGYALFACRVHPAGPYREAAGEHDLALVDVVQDTARLLAALAAEDTAEDAGALAGDARRACHKCREWATAEHVASDRHRLATCRRPCCGGERR